MKLIFSLPPCLFLLICSAITGCDAQTGTTITTWNPDIYILSLTNTVWGAETNHVKAGLNIQYSTDSTGRTLAGFVVAMYWDCDTNGNLRPNVMSLAMAPTNSRYTMALYDERGNAVAKTKFGKEHDQPFNTSPKDLFFYHGYGPVDIFPLQLDVLVSERVVLENYFVITNAGKYHLNFVLNTLKGDEHGIQPWYFPVNTEIEIKKP